jgi:hypothetical protein
MEAASREWLEATKRFLRESYPGYVEQAVTDQPEVAREKGVEGLSALKADLRALVEQVPDIVEKQLNDDVLWAHRSGTVETSAVSRQRYASEGARPPELLYAEVAKAIGQVAPLLVRHGFGQKGGFGPWAQQIGRRGTSQWRLDQPHVWSEEMNSALRRYDSLYKDIHQAFAELERIKRDKDMSEARDLWEQA